MPGRLLMIDLPGPTLDDESRAFIEANGIRAICLFQKNVVDGPQTRQLTADLRALMGADALIAIDQEGGGVLRTRDLPFAPSAMCIGATGDVALAGQVGAATARGLASLGINWNFAPVLDVNSNPLNPVIGDRSFGEDAQQVSALGLSWARGSMDEGVATCVKHFPGHGDTKTDSHLALPTVTKDRATLDQQDLLPFRDAARAGIPAFMTAHIVYTAFDKDRPATLSQPILTGLLRNEWGYRGVIITDSMGMKAIVDGYGRGDAAVLTLSAGADMVLALGGQAVQTATMDAIAAALADGRLNQLDLDAKGDRLQSLAQRVPSAAKPYSAEQQAADEALFVAAWGRGLTPYNNPKPIPVGSKLTVIVLDSAAARTALDDRGLVGQSLIERLSAHYDVQPIYYRREAPLDVLAAVKAIKRSERTVVFVTSTRQRADDGLKALIAAAKPALHLALWNPYLVLDVPAPAVASYGFRPEALQSVVSWLTGAAPAPGQFPIRLG